MVTLARDRIGVLGLVLVCAVVAIPLTARGKAFKGMRPGKTTKQQVIDKFGVPSREFSKGGKLSDGIRYDGDETIDGTLEANFYFDKHGVLFRIDVSPARELTKAQVVKVYGKDYQEGTARQGLRYVNYPDAGLLIFFEPDVDRVKLFLFTEAKAGKGG